MTSFSNVASLIEQFSSASKTTLSDEAKDKYSKAFEESVNEQLHQIQFQKFQLQKETELFMAHISSKMAALSDFESYLLSKLPSTNQ